MVKRDMIRCFQCQQRPGHDVKRPERPHRSCVEATRRSRARRSERAGCKPLGLLCHGVLGMTLKGLDAPIALAWRQLDDSAHADRREKALSLSPCHWATRPRRTSYGNRRQPQRPCQPRLGILAHLRHAVSHRMTRTSGCGARQPGHDPSVGAAKQGRTHDDSPTNRG